MRAGDPRARRRVGGGPLTVTSPSVASTSGAEIPAGRLVPLPDEGRVLTSTRRVRWGDVSAAGPARLDALGAYMADVASDDHASLGLGGDFPWVVLRVAFEISRPPVFLEDLTLHTWCSGLGLRWAERRVSMRGDQGAVVDGAILWVAYDTATGASVRVPAAYKAACGSAALGRTVSSALQHPPPRANKDVIRDPGARRSRPPWTWRAPDFDPFGHVNNASAWALVDHLLADRPALQRDARCEMEYHRPIGPNDLLCVVVEDGADGSLRAWALGTQDDRHPGELYLSATAVPLDTLRSTVPASDE